MGLYPVGKEGASVQEGVRSVKAARMRSASSEKELQMGEESRMPEDKRELLFAPAQPPGLAIPSDLPSWASKSCSKARIQLGASKSAVVSRHSLWNPAGLAVSTREMLPVSESFLYWMFLPANGRTVLSKEPERVVRLSEAPTRAELVWVWGCKIVLAEMGKDGGRGWSLGDLARSRKSEILESCASFVIVSATLKAGQGAGFRLTMRADRPAVPNQISALIVIRNLDSEIAGHTLAKSRPKSETKSSSKSA
ncbi:hypothetical protein DFH09DRAFT_1106261 [Mycena vulgaris]|nr:hypothetical protein DFH09DRAFT_1106261 [Mycena vulgaris]